MKPLKRDTAYTDANSLEVRVEQVERRFRPSRGHFEIKVFADAGALDGNLPDSATVVSTGDGKFIFAIPEDLDNYYLVEAEAYVTTVSSSGTPTVQIRNITQAVDMLSTRITIDASEFTSYTAAAPSVVNLANSQVDTGDRIAIDVDVAGTGAKGLGVILQFSQISVA